MKDWFLGLEEREQKFVAVAAVFIVLAVLYGAIWMPLDKSEERATASLATWQQSLDLLLPLRGRMGQSGGSQVSPSNLRQPLVVVIDSTLRVRQLNNFLQRSQPTGNDIRVEFESVSFDELVVWLGDVSTQYALEVKSASFTRPASDVPGRVNAQLTLGR